MRKELVEIYSDASNAAIMRHPERNFPAIMIQGDTLFSLFTMANQAIDTAKTRLDEDELDELIGVRDFLQDMLLHYKSVLIEHNIPLPFFDDTKG